jgi:hypothetical protein
MNKTYVIGNRKFPLYLYYLFKNTIMHLDLNKQASIVMEIHDKAKETHDQTRETTTVGLEEMRTLLDIEKT